MLSVIILKVTYYLLLCRLSLIWVSHFIYYYADCHYGECRYGECRYAECRYAECLYAECRYAECRYTECLYAECRYAECRYTECHYAECRSAGTNALAYLPRSSVAKQKTFRGMKSKWVWTWKGALKVITPKLIHFFCCSFKMTTVGLCYKNFYALLTR